MTVVSGSGHSQIKETSLDTHGTTRSPTVLSGPKGNWLLGCSRAIQTDFLGFLASERQQHGREMRIRMSPGWYVFGLLAPEHYEHILVTRGANYVKKTREAVMLSRMLGTSVLTDNGQSQQDARRAALPAFGSTAMEHHAPKMVSIIEHGLDDLAASARAGETVDLQREMMILTIRLAAGVLFGDDRRATAERVSAAFWQANSYLSARMARPLGPVAARIPNPRNRGFRAARRILDDAADEIVASCASAAPARSGALTPVLAAMLADWADPTRVRSEVKTFLFSGHETSSTTLAWFWHFVLSDPERLARIEDEIHEGIGQEPLTTQNAQSLTFMDRVFAEILRVYPPGYIIGRVATTDDTEFGFRIPRGSQVYLSPYVTHRDPDYWHNPERFDPDRFLPEIAATRPRFAYIPFGGGHRRCLGDRFASLELTLIAASMVRRFRIELLDQPQPEPEPLITIRPRTGLSAVLTERT